MIAPPGVPAELEEYVLRTPTRGEITPPPGAMQPETDAMAPVPINLPVNLPMSSPRRATTPGGAIRAV